MSIVGTTSIKIMKFFIKAAIFYENVPNSAASRLPNPTPSVREGEVGFTQCSDQPTRVFSRLDTRQNFA